MNRQQPRAVLLADEAETGGDNSSCRCSKSFELLIKWKKSGIGDRTINRQLDEFIRLI